MGVKTPPLSSRMRGPIFPPLPQVPFRGARESRRPTLNAPPSHYCAPFPPPTALLFPHMAVPSWAPPSPHPTPCAHHPMPSPVIPRLREESPHPTLNAPQSHYCAPFPPPTALLFPHMAAPRGRPPPHPTHCRAPSYTFPCHSEAPRESHHPTLNAPPSHYCAPFPPPTALPLPPHGRPPWAPFPPILPIAAHHPIPSPVIPRLREESHHPTLNAPPSHYCAPFPPPNALPFPRRGAPRGRPPPSRCPRACGDPSPLAMAPCHSEHSGAEESRRSTLNTPPPIHLLDQPPLKKRLHKPVCVIRPFPHLRHIQPLQNLEAMRPLPIPPLPRAITSPLKPSFNVLLRNLLHVRIRRKRLPPKTLPEVSLQSVLVSEEPRLHDLHHQMTLVISRALGPTPSVALL